jgi:hypothetical protein
LGLCEDLDEEVMLASRYTYTERKKTGVGVEVVELPAMCSWNQSDLGHALGIGPI